MAWSRLEDDLDENEKVASFSDRTFRLWILSIPFSTRRRTCGFLSPDHIRLLTVKCGASGRNVEELVEKGGWERVQGGYLIHDYAKYHPKDPTAAERAKRYRDRNAGRDEYRDAKRNANRNAVTVGTVTSSGSGTLPDPDPDTPPLSPPRDEPLRDPNPTGGEREDYGNGGTPDPDPDEPDRPTRTEIEHATPGNRPGALADVLRGMHTRPMPGRKLTPPELEARRQKLVEQQEAIAQAGKETT